MIKKAILGTAALAMIGGMVFGRDAFSYARTGANTVTDAIRSEVPIEFEIERARQMVTELMPEVRRSMHVIAEEQVEIEQLEEGIAKREARLAEQELAMKTLSTDLNSGKDEFRYSGRTYTVSAVQKDLSHRFDRFKVSEETLDREKQILDAKHRALNSHRQQLENMLTMRKDLEVQLEQLEARVRSVQAAETVSNLDLDDSQLNRAKGLIRRLNKELDIKERMLDAEGNLTDLIQLETEETTPVDIAEQVTKYFDGEEIEVDTQLVSRNEKK